MLAGATADSLPALLGLDYSLHALLRYCVDVPAVCATAERLPLATGCVDLVLTIACLEHVPRPELAFAEIDRVLAPGGIVYLAPAWHVRAWASEGLSVRPWRDLTRASGLPRRYFQRVTTCSGSGSRRFLGGFYDA